MTTIPRRDFICSVGSAAVAAGATVHLAGPSAKAVGSKIKIGQIGAAHGHAGGKMSTVRKFSDIYEVVGIVEPDPELRRAMDKNDAYKGVPRLTEEQLLTTKGLQAVAVETAVRDLVPTALRCAEADVHIHLDKPAGESLTAFKQLLDETMRRGRTVQMGYMFRYNPALQFLHRALDDGWLGEVFEVDTVMSKTVSAADRKQLAGYSGGSMFELGGHVIDAVVSVLGKPDRVTAYARHTRPEKDELADNQLAVLEYPEATATIRVAVIEVEGVQRRQFVVCGDQGTIDIRPIEPPTVRMALSQPRGRFSKGYQDVKLSRLGGRYDGDFIDLAAIIRGEKETDYPVKHDLIVHETILRASGVPLN